MAVRYCCSRRCRVEAVQPHRSTCTERHRCFAAGLASDKAQAEGTHKPKFAEMLTRYRELKASDRVLCIAGLPLLCDLNVGRSLPPDARRRRHAPAEPGPAPAASSERLPSGSRPAGTGTLRPAVMLLTISAYPTVYRLQAGGWSPPHTAKARLNMRVLVGCVCLFYGTTSSLATDRDRLWQPGATPVNQRAVGCSSKSGCHQRQGDLRRTGCQARTMEQALCCHGGDDCRARRFARARSACRQASKSCVSKKRTAMLHSCMRMTVQR